MCSLPRENLSLLFQLGGVLTINDLTGGGNGFEPTEPPALQFKTGAIDHSTTPPGFDAPSVWRGDGKVSRKTRQENERTTNLSSGVLISPAELFGLVEGSIGDRQRFIDGFAGEECLFFKFRKSG